MRLRLPAIYDRKWSIIQIGLTVFACSFMVRLSIMLVLRSYDHPLRTEIHHLAYSIANGQGYGNPYPTPTGPTALYSPGCPLILAGIYRLFGIGRIAEVVTYVVDIAAASVVFALLPTLSILLGLPRRVGVAAAFAGALIPVYLLNEYRSTTADFGALCLMGLTLMTALVWRGKQAPSLRLGVVFGLAWGCALLISPNLLLIGLLWLVATALHYRTKALGFSAVVLAVTLAVLSPWAIRNEVVLGAPIFSRSNFGLELWIANNDVSTASYDDNGESHMRYQPFINPVEADKVRRLGEVTYMREKMDSADTWIEQHPRRFVMLTGNRILRFWFLITFRPIQTIIVWGLSVAGIAGLVYLWARQRSAFWILGSIWLAYPLVYYMVQLDNPYRYPIYWSVLLLAAFGCMCSIDVLRKHALPHLQRLFAHVRPATAS